jgi:hypothetical protein
MQVGESLLPHDTAGHQAVKKPVTVDVRGKFHQNAVQHFPRSFPAACEVFNVKGH